jgi:hypothetical protein
MADELKTLNTLKMRFEGEHIDYYRQNPGLKVHITIYPSTLTPEQQQRLGEIEQELIAMAHEATEEMISKTSLKKAKGAA